MNCELMLTYDTPEYMFNMQKNQLSRQTGSKNLTGPKYLGWTEERTDRGKTVYPFRWSGGIIIFRCEDDVRFVLDQHTKMDLYSVSSLKQQSVRGQTCGSQQRSSKCQFYSLAQTRPCFEPTIYHIRGEHANNYTTDTFICNYLSSNFSCQSLSGAHRKKILNSEQPNCTHCSVYIV